MITNSEKLQIKSLLQDSKWQTVEHIATTMCDKIKYESVIAETEWQTITAVLTNDGKVKGIKQFIQELYAIAQES